jgi:hypothetical protein
MTVWVREIPPPIAFRPALLVLFTGTWQRTYALERRRRKYVTGWNTSGGTKLSTPGRHAVAES